MRRRRSVPLMLILAAVVVWASVVVPSSTAIAQLSVGVTLGSGKTGLSGDKPDKASYASRTALVAGAIIEYGFKPDIRISFQPGISQSGTTISFKIAGVEEKRDSLAIKLDYINLPLLARVVTDGGGWYVTGGPYVGLLQSVNGTPEGGGQDLDLSDEVISYDLGAIFGIGHFFPLGPVEAYVEFRMVQGLVNIREQTDGDIRLRNKGRQLHFGFLYRLGS